MKTLTLKAARVNAGLTQSDVARAIKVTARTLHSWEVSATYPTIDKLLLLCDLYGILIGDIFIPT